MPCGFHTPSGYDALREEFQTALQGCDSVVYSGKLPPACRALCQHAAPITTPCQQLRAAHISVCVAAVITHERSSNVRTSAPNKRDRAGNFGRVSATKLPPLNNLHTDALGKICPVVILDEVAAGAVEEGKVDAQWTIAVVKDIPYDNVAKAYKARTLLAALQFDNRKVVAVQTSQKRRRAGAQAAWRAAVATMGAAQPLRRRFPHPLGLGFRRHARDNGGHGGARRW